MTARTRWARSMSGDLGGRIELVPRAVRERRRAELVARCLPVAVEVPAPKSRPPLQHDPADPECVCDQCDPEVQP